MVVQDLTSFGKLRLRGPDRGRFLQGMLSADVLALGPGGFVRAALLSPRGHVAAVVDVVREAEAYLLVTEPATAAAVAETLARHIIADDVSVEPVAGPAHRRWASPADVWLAPPVLEPAAPSPDALVLARRIEGGLPAWGADIAAEMSPLEVGLERAVSLTKGCYIGQELLARVASSLRNQHLLGATDETGTPSRPVSTTSTSTSPSTSTSRPDRGSFPALSLGVVPLLGSLRPSCPVVLVVVDGDVDVDVVDTLPSATAESNARSDRRRCDLASGVLVRVRVGRGS